MSKPKNATFNLPPELIEKYKMYVRHNKIPSVNAGVKEAMQQYSIRMDKEIFRQEMVKASQDPLFIKDLDDSMKVLETIDGESAAKENSEW